ncbi:hypothetical protein LTR28_011847, partial [Elasticomyces elasticus]
MALAEDAASVLELFVHDVANLPAEIAHLLEEIQAKDQQIHQCRDTIAQRDNALQKWVRANGANVRNPKEEAFSKTILANMDRAEILQAEKVALSEKAMIVLDRQVKRFDLKIRELQNTDQFPLDPLPSLLNSTSTLNTPATGANTPLQSVPTNAVSGGAPNIANAAIARMQHSAANRGFSSPIAAINPLLSSPHLASTSASARHARESSLASDSNKRRRPNSTLGALPAASSNLRQSSLGPGTPAAGTPSVVSRAGSAQPSRPITTKKAAASS